MEQNENTPRTPRRRTPYQRNRRKQASWLSSLLIGCMIVFILLGILTRDRDFSPNENRKLAGRPKITLSALADGSYLSSVSDYTADQFPGRDLWISLNLSFNRLLGQKEASGIYLGKDHYLMQIPSAPNEEQLQRNLDAINRFSASYPELNMVMSVIPNAVTVLSDKLPANAPVRDQAADLKGIMDRLASVQFLDVTAELKSHADKELFYHTDHHWTSLGAYYAFKAIGPRLGVESVPALTDYTVYPVSTTFQGTLASRSGSHSYDDTVEIFVPNTEIEYFVSYPDGTQICSLYKREALDAKDHYTVFFGGNYARLDVTTTADTEKNLLLFKDSYANCFVQFLYPYFDHITIIDPRYYYDNVQNVVKSEKITDVLFLYNLDTFLSDTSLADVLLSGE